MPASAQDSAIHGALFGDAELARLFSDSAELRAMLLVEGALARAQGALGLIPETAAAFIDRAAREVLVDPSALAGPAAQNGVPVPGFVAAARAAMQAPEHAAWLHYGATSQDIMDTALVLRLRQALAIIDDRLAGLIRALGRLAGDHADLPMMARTYGQDAVPTSFGATVATWGTPLIRHRDRLAELRPRLLVVSLSGAAGTLSAMGPKGPQVRAGLAEALGLSDPGESWHAARDRMAELAGWCAGLSGSLVKLGEDVIGMAATVRGEITLGATGGSSTMPQKRNPVGPSALVALGRMALALAGALQGAAAPREARDASAWMVEWLALPQMVIATGRALALASDTAETLAPDPAALARPLTEGLGLWAAEAVTFALTESRPRPEAEAAAKALVAGALATATPLAQCAAEKFPEVDWPARLAPTALLGEAPALARRFAKAARAP